MKDCVGKEQFKNGVFLKKQRIWGISSCMMHNRIKTFRESEKYMLVRSTARNPGLNESSGPPGAGISAWAPEQPDHPKRKLEL